MKRVKLKSGEYFIVCFAFVPDKQLKYLISSVQKSKLGENNLPTNS
jgi:hypothetical protein